MHCPLCGEAITEEETWGNEPYAQVLVGKGIEGHVDDSNDIWVVKSDYYTHSQFCSPCAPGAGHLNNPCEEGPRTYCLGADWFTDEKAPYPIFEVKGGGV